MTALLERTGTATVDAGALKLATAWAARALPARAPQPALAGMLLSTTDGELTLTAWDWNTLCTTTVDCAGDLGTILVNGSLLSDIAAQLTGLATLELDGSELLARSGSGRSRYRMRLMVAEEYPPYRPAPVVIGTAKALGEALGRVVHAAAKEPAAGTNLNAVSVEARGGQLRLLATDGHQLARAVTTWEGPDIDFAVDARRLAGLAKELGGWDVQLGLDPDRISIHAGGRTAVLGQMAGKYHTYTSTEPYFGRSWSTGYADLDKADLLTAVAEASPTLERLQHAAGTLRLAFTAGEVEVSSSANELGASTSAAGCHLDGEPRTELFSAEYLLNALKAIPADVVRISFAPTAGNPTLFSPLTAAGEIDLANSHIVMAKKEIKS